MTPSLRTLVIGTLGAAIVGAPVLAADKVRLISSNKQVFETETPYAAKEAGIFKKYGLDVSIIHGAGGAASLRAVLSGDRDVVWGTGALGVLAAYSRGEPVRILGSNMRGVADIYWYVKSDSWIEKFTDLRARHELTYSRPGSTTNLATIYIKKALDLGAKLAANTPSARVARRLGGPFSPAIRMWFGAPARLVCWRPIREANPFVFLAATCGALRISTGM